MRRSPLVAALLSGTFAFQLLLAGGGATCIDPEHGSSPTAASAERHSMSGMDMGTDMPTHASATDAPQGQPAPDDAACDEPVTPGDCQILAPCAGGFFASPLAVIQPDDRMPAGAVPHPALELSSRAFPPEPPPPRA